MLRYQTILVLLLVLSVATCVIAYLSDKLGMKLGKKRISLLGLRPRQTATALSMGSSLLVMLFTMGLLLLTFPALRGALLHYDEARRENTRLGSLNQQLKTTSQQQQDAIQKQTEANKELETSLSKRNIQLTKLNNPVGEKQRLVTDAQRQLNVATQNLSNATQARQAAQNARDAAQRAQQEAQRGEAQARSGETEARAQFAQAQAAFEQAQRQEIAARRGVVRAQAQLSGARVQLSGARVQLSAARTELNGIRTALSSTRTALSSTRFTLSSTRTQLSSARTQLTDARKQTTAAKKQTAEAQRQAFAAQRRTVESLRSSAQAEVKLALMQKTLGQADRLLSGDIKVVVPAGQTFGTTLLPTRATKEQSLESLRFLLAQANQNVRQSGFRLLRLESIEVQQGDQTAELSEEQNLELHASFLAEQNAPISVRLVAARDYGENENEIVGRLQALAVRQVFAPGDVIAQTTISGEQSGAAGEALVFSRLMSLMDEGQKAATARGISPLPTKDEPSFFASDTSLRIFEAKRQIQQKGGDVPVRLVAATGLSTVEPVRVRIEVGSSGAPAPSPLAAQGT
ncbi:MAG TPA: DUF3084 domain-containing protein [Abditibacteriaceae bacterium]|nr:DUF3084 domain-containing protein [Abditibacteriaceae bacterium]